MNIMGSPRAKAFRGIVSNTPPQYFLEQDQYPSSLVFQVDLFSARGTLPRSMSEVLTRQKEIMYSSRARQNTDAFARLHNMKMRLAEALQRAPPEALQPGERNSSPIVRTPQR